MTKRNLGATLLALLAFCFILAQQTIAANQTPTDNHQRAADRLFPKQMRRYSLTLSDGTVSSVSIGDDVKTAKMTCTGVGASENVLFNVSYHNGTSQETGDLITSGSDQRILKAKHGEPFNIGQEYEYNYIFARIEDEDGDVECDIYPGRGLSQ